MSNVLLLRNPSPPDPYDTELRTAGFAPTSLSVLETSFVNRPSLSSLQITNPPSYGGVVITSARGAQAWRAAATRAIANSNGRAALDAWSVLPFYVVGGATARALSPSSDETTDVPTPVDIRGADSTGTAVQLAAYIVADPDRPVSVLVLTGDKNSDTLPTTLENGDMRVLAQQVYETRGAATFPSALAEVMESAKDSMCSPCRIPSRQIKVYSRR
jgi:uroporphyrinogen-III synthase